MKKIIIPFIAIAAFFVYQYNSIVNYIRFYFAKQKANRLHKLTGKRYHVLPSGNKLFVCNNTFVDNYNRLASGKKGVKKITIETLLKMSYYSTSCGTTTRYPLKSK